MSTLGKLLATVAVALLLWRAYRAPAKAAVDNSRNGMWIEGVQLQDAQAVRATVLPKRIITCTAVPGNIEFTMVGLHETLCWNAQRQAFVRIEIKEQ